MKQPYTLEEINEKEFNEKVENMVAAIQSVKEIIVCDDTVEECTNECPLKLVCREKDKVVVWGMLKKIM